MAVRAVCISGKDGAGAAEVGRLVAERLGYQVVDEDIVARAAQEAGVEPHVVADVERRKTFLARLLDDLDPAAMGAAASFGGFVPAEVAEASGRRDDLRALVRTAIEETAARGGAVILAHAASHALSDRQDVLRVLVTAGDEARRRRLAAEAGQEDRVPAKAIERADRNRADYLKRFYGVGEECPEHYDLVVNTERLTTEQAAELVCAAARS